MLTYRDDQEIRCPNCGGQGMRFVVDHIEPDRLATWEVGIRYCRTCYHAERHATVREVSLPKNVP